MVIWLFESSVTLKMNQNTLIDLDQSEVFIGYYRFDLIGSWLLVDLSRSRLHISQSVTPHSPAGPIPPIPVPDCILYASESDDDINHTEIHTRYCMSIVMQIVRRDPVPEQLQLYPAVKGAQSDGIIILINLTICNWKTLGV